MSSRLLALGLSAGLMTAATGAMAAEENAPAQPPQTHDIRAAELPPIPGFYGGLAYGTRLVRELTDDNGDAVFPDTSLTQHVVGLSGLYVLPQEFRGGNLGLYGVSTWQAVNGNPGGPIPAVDTGGEWVDAVVGVVWSKSEYQIPEGPPTGPPPGFAYALGLQATIPGGEGSLESFVISPNVSLTYRTEPLLLDGTEFSARLSYNHVRERDSGRIPGFTYKDGDYLALDFALTERYRNFQFGLIGTYMTQVQDDEPGAGYPGPNGGRMEELALGAVVNMDLGPTSAIKMRYTTGVSSSNLAAGDLFGVQFVQKF